MIPLTAEMTEAVVAAVAPLIDAAVRADIAAEIEALRDRHFQQYGNEESGPRNYDWALTHAANIARNGDPLGAVRVAGGDT